MLDRSTNVAIVQDAAYAMLPRQKRQLLHSRVADALENSFPDTIETQPELLAHHLAQAGSIERGIEYLRKAGQRSIERSSNVEAIGHRSLRRELNQKNDLGRIRIAEDTGMRSRKLRHRALTTV
jgi:predicted ATPase